MSKGKRLRIKVAFFTLAVFTPFLSLAVGVVAGLLTGSVLAAQVAAVAALLGGYGYALDLGERHRDVIG